jgi:hypothetical protein
MTDDTQRALEREYRRLRALERLDQGLAQPKWPSREPLDLEEMARLQRKWYAKTETPSSSAPSPSLGPPPSIGPIAVFKRLTLWPDRIVLAPGWLSGKQPEERPLTGVRVTVVPGVRPRLFDFGTPQKPYLTISGPGFEWPYDLGLDQVGPARKFAAQVNATASALDSQAATATGPSDLVTKLAELAKLRQAGMLTDEEFAAAKARLLLDGEGGAGTLV